MQAPKPFRVERPWGEFIEFTKNTPSTVKIITVRAGEAFSLQTHSRRDEFWRVLSGEGTVTIDKSSAAMRIGDTYFIPKNTAHRIQAGASDVVVLEISFGEFDERDIRRLEDKYGRT